jgi:integrase
MRLAAWGEIDRPNKVWNIPFQHLKTGKIHKRDRPIPITPQMEPLLDELQRRRTDQSPEALVFPSPQTGGAYGAGNCSQFLSRMLKWTTPKIDVHGFRSTFTDWAFANGFPTHLIDIQLDHAIGNTVDQAYFRDQLFEQRRVMMTAYNEYIDRPTPAAATNVAQFKRRRAS